MPLFALALVSASLTSPHTGGKRLPLTAAEKATIREVVYGPAGLGIAFDRELGRDVFEGPEGVEAIYARKPVFAMQYLLKIVETGRPLDALRAAIFALEYKNGLGKYCVADLLELEDLDKPSGEPKKTQRERYPDRLRDMPSRKKRIGCWIL